MATRAATFSAKIRNLKDYHYRMANGVSPLPSGVDIANTLKYFSQTLLSVLTDVPIIPQESYGRQSNSVRLSVFPNLNYYGLYEAVVNILEVFPQVLYGQQALGEAILNVIGCVVPFLENDILDTLPYTVASMLAMFPSTLHRDIVLLLCTNLLPVTLGYEGMNDSPTYATDSTAAIIMMVLQYIDVGELQSQLLECVMSMKKNVMKDLLSVIAYGPPTSKAPAVSHLFHYLPQMNPALTDRRGIHYKYSAWQPVMCQRANCPNSGEAKAVKRCMDPAVSIQCGDRPPPLYLCVDCVDQVSQDHAQYLSDILGPLEKVSLTCENKNCTAAKNQAVSTCFSLECASFNGNRPIRYCRTCHMNRHPGSPATDHVFHMTVGDVWSCEPELQSYLVEAIVTLLKEAQPMEEKRVVEMGEERMRQQHFDKEDEVHQDESDERKLLSRYGIWLMVELCKPKEDLPIEILGRLLAMLFQWFDATAYLPDDNVGNALERLKPEYICGWLKLVSKNHFEVILSCLLPHPVDYARVGGYWETLSNRTSQIKEGLNRLCCLVPYDVITYEVWDYVIPFWLEAVKAEVPEEERNELRVLLSKLFDTEMCPLPFPVEKMYHFVAERFDNTTAAVQEQNLCWLQILSSLDIIIPVKLSLSMLKTGCESLINAPPPPPPGEEEATTSQPPPAPGTVPLNLPLDDLMPGSPMSPFDDACFTFEAPPQEDIKVSSITCYILMLDLLVKQMEVQDTIAHQGVNNDINKELMDLLTQMVTSPWGTEHVCKQEDVDCHSCEACEVAAVWHQLATQIMEFMVPEKEIDIPVIDLPKVEDLQHRSLADKKGDQPETVPEHASPEQVMDARKEQERILDIPNLPPHLRLLHSLLEELEEEEDSDALFYLLKTIKLLCLHAECLNQPSPADKKYVKFCLKFMLLPLLWKHLQAEHSHVSVMCVPLLLHCLTLPSGADVLHQMVEENFGSEDWKTRFAAVEKATVIARLVDPSAAENNQVILTALAHIFCYLIGGLNDVHSAVVQRTAIYLETIKESGILCMCHCLEFQFDSVISDRTTILHRLYLLQVTLKEHEILTWDFFLNRFDTLCLEAQIDLEGTSDIACLTDLTCSDRQSEHFLKKINRARFALARTDSIRSVSSSVFVKPPYRRAASVPMHLMAKTASLKGNTTLLNLINEKQYPRQQSAPQFGRRDPRGSRFGLNMFGNYMFPGGHLREFTDEESNFAALLQRAMDLQGVDRETVHLLVTLLMKFMGHSDQSSVNEDREMSKAQNIVLRHLNVLLGYNQTEKAFSVPPYKLRYSAVFSAYLAVLPMVLDTNFSLGNIILPVSMMLLQYAPSPQRYASDYQPANYTLWLLEPHSRQSWLQSLIVILYKYQYNISPASTTIQFLVKLVVNTVESQLHRCKKFDDTFGLHSPIIPRNRDTSNVSIGDLENIQETDTPPQSPTDSQRSTNDMVTINMETPGHTVHYRKRGEQNHADETDIESMSPNSKRTLQQSVEEYFFSQVAGRSEEDLKKSEGEGDEQDSDGVNNNVDRKMVQELAAFASQSERRRKTTSSEDSPSGDSDLNKDSDQSKDSDQHRPNADPPVLGSKPEAATGSSDESPHRVPKPRLSKTQSAGLIEAKGGKFPAKMTRRHTERAFNEITDDQLLDVRDADDANTAESDIDESPCPSPTPQPRIKPNYRQRKARKTGLTTVELQKMIPELQNLGMGMEGRQSPSPRRARKSDLLSRGALSNQQKKSQVRYSEVLQVDRCPECNAILEQYDEDTVSLCIISLATFIHREPSLAAPLLLDSLFATARIASSSPYPWQSDISGLIIPGNSVSVARQFMRTVLHQLAPNGIFAQIFMTQLEDPDFLKTIAAALVDFAELNCNSALQCLLEGINEMKNVSSEQMMQVVENLSTYMDYIALETGSPHWNNILFHFDLFFRRLPTFLPDEWDTTPVLKIMIGVLKIPGLTSVKTILEPFSKILGFTVENCSFKLQHLQDICSLCSRAFTKERDKLFLARSIIFELVQALKFKVVLPDDNLLMLVQFLCMDSGGTLGPTAIVQELAEMTYNPYTQSLISTNAAECMKQHLSECVEFIADLHTITKVKSSLKGGSHNLNEDTLGSHLKAGIAQYVALEFTRGNGRDNRAISRYLPWLYHPPLAMQQGPKEFIDSVGHMRLLSWLLLGSLIHTAVTKAAGPIICQPIPLEASAHIADHIMVIMTGFAEQSKASVLHMSSLFHAFILCQLWTMYCESFAALNSEGSESYQVAHATIMDFWGRVTPGILQLLSHSKVLSEMVNLHFISLMEALQECNSTVLSKLFPMWTPILYSYHSQLPGHLQVRLQMVQNWEPKEQKESLSMDSHMLLTWLKKLQFKLGQIEVQSSAATQFYTV